MGNKTSLCTSRVHRSDYHESMSTQGSLNTIKGRMAQPLGLENFKILKVIGRGSFGKVMLV